MTKPRVLFVSPVSHFKGGAEVVMQHMLNNPHVEPVLAAPTEGPVADAANAAGITTCYYRPTAMLNVHRPPMLIPILAAVLDSVRCALRLRRLAKQHGCSVIHSNGLKPHILCAILGSSTKLKTLVHLHDIAYRKSERAIWRLIAGRVSQVVIVSRPCYPAARLPRHVAVVHNGIPVLRQSLPVATRSAVLRLGFVGRFHPNKGLDLLLDWFNAIRAQGIDATLTIRGRPDPDLPCYWQAIQDRISREGLSEHIHDEGWVTGVATFQNLDMLLVTSKTPDPLPLVVPEAMSAGVVVVGYDAGGIPEMIEDGRTGLLATDGAVLACRISELWTDGAAFDRMRAAAFEHASSEFAMARFHKRMLEVYQSMLGGRANQPSPAAARVREPETV